MTPAQFREAQERLAPTEAEASLLLGVDVRTIRNYRTKTVPEPVARLLRLMLAMHLTADQVLAILRQERDARTHKEPAA